MKEQPTCAAGTDLNDPEAPIASTAAKKECEAVEVSDAVGRPRQKWGRQIEFILSSLSYAVGLGNIWRFPYLCYRNGGGAFLIPYGIMLMVCGMPLMFFELCLGQFGREGPITVWKICPLFQGIGYAMFMISFYIGCYYNVVLAWAIYYIYSSFTHTLPWTSCNDEWRTEFCKEFNSRNCTLAGGLMNVTGNCVFPDMVTADEWNNLNKSLSYLKSPADEFFHNHVLDITDGLHDMGGFQGNIVIALLVAWIIVYFVLIKGVETFGKAVYFTATFPYLILIVLLVRAATLPGYMDGIRFYLTPNWDKILRPSVWGDAAIQIFFSLSPCWGGLITLASYNRFNNNCYRDAFVVSIGNCLTSFFAGFVIFGIIGFMAHELGVPVEKVAVQGAGLAFVAYPEAVARLPLSPVWSILFFAMLLTLGLGTQFTILTTIITTITDDFPALRGKNFKWALLCSCLVMFAVGLSMATKGGMYVLQMMDSYSSTFSALMVGMAEVMVVTWVYGVDNFLNDIKTMLGKYPYPMFFWKYVWKFGMPLVVLTILVFSWIDFTPAKYGDYEFPPWANVLGWFLSFSSVSLIPAVAIYKILGEKGSFLERIKKLCKPQPTWAPPADVTIRPNDSFGAKPLLKVTSFDEDTENKI
ncbi:sodium- and chloride-dependent glycine transporter 1-like isoform X1 [Penaeus chinensis]|uniref:sodium- and chloride-dependent glycine transporter 1-like isoform X1 n=1 Tax=Penaeus chinensis TaxID=139456 RepID=UPI001FB7425D|nr:sodium- and chloride-dependent glycine transporter 1-like isoform X1 [Penaeus chinensis]